MVDRSSKPVFCKNCKKELTRLCCFYRCLNCWKYFIANSNNIYKLLRYQKIYTKADTPNLNKTISSFLICLLFGLFWALAPLYGWSYYTLEGGLTSCCVKWNEKSFNIISYNTALFIFGYLVPLIIIIFCNIKLLNHVIIYFYLFKVNLLTNQFI